MRCRFLWIIGSATVAQIVLVHGVPSAHAATFTEIRIGDVDGFGYGTGAGYWAANGGPANLDGVGVLGTGDFLPDINGDGLTQTYQGDDFDFRSAAEVAGNSLTGSGYTDVGSSGSHFTDISLSTSYDSSSAAGQVLTGTGFGSGGLFPKPPSTTLSNQPGFAFDFFVATGDITSGTALFFNLVFGDYDVAPANVKFTRADGTTSTQALTVQPTNADGLIQAAFANLLFTDVFAPIAGGYAGRLDVDFVAPSEPYTAFDFAEISVTQIPTEPIPEPASLIVWSLLAALGITLGWWRWRRKA